MTDVVRDPFTIGEPLQRLFAMSGLLLPLLEDGQPAAYVPDGRRLALDMKVSHPARSEAFLLSDLTSTFSHVETLRAMVTAGLVYPFAPLTLLRSAQEAIARSLWLLSPSSRTERVRRSLARTAKSLNDYERFIGEISGSKAEHQSLRDGVIAAGARAGLDLSDRRRLREHAQTAQMTRIFEAIEELNGAGRFRSTLWRYASAFAHNDDTLIANLSRATSSDRRDDLLHARVTPDEEWIDWIAAWLGLDASRVLVLARQHGVVWPGNEDVVDRAIAIFPNTEVREQREKLERQLSRRRR